MDSAGRRLALALLSVLAAAQIYLRVRQDVSLPYFNPDADTGFFRNESAIQYRYALLVANGAGIPELDRDAQYPEGIRTRQELTLTMERATGWTWRVINLFTPLRDFRWFVLLFCAVMSSLAVPAFYAIALRLSRSAPLALASAAIFALSWAGMANGIGTYVFESFTLPLLLASLAFLVAALDSEERLWRVHSAAAGALLGVALASWHFSRFHLAALFIALAWTGWRCRRDEAASSRLRVCVGVLVACAGAAGLLCAPLRETAFILSPVMLLGYGLLLALVFPRRVLPIALGTAAALGLSSYLSRELSAYGHVYGMFWEKLRHGLRMPADPAQLSADARLLWMGPFQSPAPGFLIFAFVPLGFIMVPRVAAALFGKGESPPEKDGGPLPPAVVDALLVFYLAGTALILRLTPVLAFLLCAAATRLPQRWLRAAWLPPVFFLLAALEGAKTLAPSSRFNPVLRISAAWAGSETHPGVSSADVLALIRWLRKNGGPDRPVLANFGLSASLLTYAGSPVLLQPKFEAPGIRAKTMEFLRSLYAGEPEFLAFCRRYGATLFVYSTEDILDEAPGGPRYASGGLRLKPDAAAVLFHFRPEELKGFRLLYENQSFRVFAVGQKPAGPARAADPVYDLARFSPSVDEGGALRLDVAGVSERMALARRTTILARILARLGRGEEALSAYESAFAAWPPREGVRQEAERLRQALKASGS
ncbi:MAG: hypothetical protein NTY77_20785 [Elusimicrobia bacterium]|nr:hypothetical protein [Elusimicrobiota bacterium]